MNGKINVERLQKAIERLLAFVQVSRPPVPVEQIAQLRGIPVRTVPYADSLAGLLFWEGGQPTIGINSLLDIRQQRFVLAHELAHVEMHHYTGTHIDRSFPYPLNLQQTAVKIEPAEFEASIVAVGLLIPTAMITADFKEKTLDYLDETVVYSLAQRYEVSAHTMLLRLAQLAGT